MLAPNLIIIWPGTNASIPTGFTRETALDGKYPKGAAAAANPNTTGGNATHTHTSPAHSHTLSSHTHAFTLNAWNSGKFSGATYAPTDNLQDLHSHSGTSGSTGGSSSSDAVTYGAVSNDPPYYTVIFIKSNGYQAIPDDAVVLLNGDTIPDGFANFDALDQLYPKGAATEADAGDTGGSYTNSHDISHTHTGASHQHSATSGSSPNQNRHKRPSGSDGYMGNHTHSFTFDSAVAPINANTDTLVTAETVEPAYTKLRAIQNTSGNSKLAQQKMIAMYLGNLNNIPPGWKLCNGSNGTVDMQGRYIKATTQDTETADTGGSNTHTHAAQSHSHTGGTHSHTAPNQTGVGANNDGDNSGGEGVSTFGGGARHTVTVSSASPTYGSANTTADSSSNEPPYRTVLFLEFDFLVGGGGLLALL